MQNERDFKRSFCVFASAASPRRTNPRVGSDFVLVTFEARERLVGSGNVGSERSERKPFFSAKCRNRADVQSECARMSESDRECQMSAISVDLS